MDRLCDSFEHLFYVISVWVLCWYCMVLYHFQSFARVVMRFGSARFEEADPNDNETGLKMDNACGFESAASK